MTIRAFDHGDGIELRVDQRHEVAPGIYRVSYTTMRVLMSDLLTLDAMQWRVGEPPLTETLSEVEENRT